MPSIIALIPARAGSKRVADKNIRLLAGHPVMAYTICAARQSGIFADIVVSTDAERYATIARHYGAEVPFLRPAEFAGDRSPDIEWVEYTMNRLKKEAREYECFSILRPTSPFRLPETIQRAWGEFLAEKGVDSLRAVEKCKQHPAKMWLTRGDRRMVPVISRQLQTQLFGKTEADVPWHSSQYQALPEVYAQNASLEIAWTSVVFEGRAIAGNVIMPFFTRGYEGFDINQPYDWKFAEELVRRGEAVLPEVDIKPFEAT